MGRKLATVTATEVAEILGMSPRSFRSFRSRDPWAITPIAIGGKTGRQHLFSKRDALTLKKELRNRKVRTIAATGSY